MIDVGSLVELLAADGAGAALVRQDRVEIRDRKSVPALELPLARLALVAIETTLAIVRIGCVSQALAGVNLVLAIVVAGAIAREHAVPVFRVLGISLLQQFRSFRHDASKLEKAAPGFRRIGGCSMRKC